MSHLPPSRAVLAAALAMVALLPSPALAAEGSEGGHLVIRNIALCIVAASLLGLLMRALRQPLILGYLLAGVIIGPLGVGAITDQREIVEIAEIGLILLLFMIGLEIDLKRMLAAGRLVVVTGLVQVPICLGLGYLAFRGLAAGGQNVGSGDYFALYAGFAIAISSTMIVVKLLYDSLAIDTLPGRITIGVLVFQDIWAILFLAVQPDLADPRLGAIAGTFAAGALVVAAALLASRYLLPLVFHSVAKIPELMLVLSLGWCFVVALVAAHPLVGLSMEMGALIAGVSLATFPYSMEVTGKVTSIRDFFITLFFVALGMQIPMPQGGPLLAAALMSLVLLVSRFVGVFGVLQVLGSGQRVALLSSLNLAQMSEFALVIIALGVSFGHVGQELLTSAIWAFAFLAVGSTYLVKYSHHLQRLLSVVLGRLGLSDLDTHADAEGHKTRPVVLLGFFRIASAFLDELERRSPGLLREVLVLDFNPEVKKRLERRGVHVLYCDVTNTATLHHADIEHARVILCTLPDDVLRGASNMNLLLALRAMCPHADIVVTATSPAHARELYEAGAAYVLQPYADAAAAVIDAVELGLAGTLGELRAAQRAELAVAHPILE
jgi:Kef-type K+ transport system membrane component KefB/voltage-gated potassium channel Kch